MLCRHKPVSEVVKSHLRPATVFESKNIPREKQLGLILANQLDFWEDVVKLEDLKYIKTEMLSKLPQ